MRLEIEGPPLHTNRYLRSLAEAATSELDLAVLSSVAAWSKWPSSQQPTRPHAAPKATRLLVAALWAREEIALTACAEEKLRRRSGACPRSPDVVTACLPGVVLRRDGTQTIEGYAVLMVKRGPAPVG